MIIEIYVERQYELCKVKNGWILDCLAGAQTYVCDTLGEALDQMDAEEKKFPNDSE